jgi:hypothetical protein
MISYHANVSGNIDRITVLMEEMTEIFHLPLQSINFQLLFKGFCLHGATMDKDARWNVKRLDMVWHACRIALKDAEAHRWAADTKPEPTLPSMKDVNTAAEEESRLKESSAQATSSGKTYKRLSTWNDFVLDLAVFPRQRRKHIERVHAQLFDEDVDRRNSGEHAQQSYYPLGEAQLDLEEGEYVLPPPNQAIDPNWSEHNHVVESTSDPMDHESVADPSIDIEEKSPSKQQSAMEEFHIGMEGFKSPFFRDENSASQGLPGKTVSESPSEHVPPTTTVTTSQDEYDPDARPEDLTQPHQIRATKQLICWLLRAYARCTGSRARVEETWNSARKIWRPRDPLERDAVVGVLRRCLSDCDRYGPPL